MGAIPPLSQDAWLDAFSKYQRIPQYKLINHGMTLESFKWIFFWEYLHRLIGRSIALVYVLPWIWNSRRGFIAPRLHKRLALGLVLFGLQGVMGWVMVVSGLSERTSVSHYRLAAHLTLALTVLGYMLWVLRQELPRRSVASASPDTAEAHALAMVKRGITALTALVCVQIVYGAFMAGLKAGFMYATFPLMNGKWFPDGALAFQPSWINFLENPAAVHFMHRALGWGVIIGAIAVWSLLLRYRRILPRKTRVLAMAATHSTFLQFALGVATVMSHVAIPIAVIHQVWGALVLAALLWARYTLTRPRA